MSALKVVEKVASRTASFGIDGSREYTRVFRVRMSRAGDGCLTAVMAPGIPPLGLNYATTIEYDLGAICRSLEPRQISKYVYEVTAKYSSKPSDSEEQDPNPLLRPPDIAWSKATYGKPLAKDLDGKPVVNSAGQPYDPPVEIERTRQVLTITRNELAYDYDLAEEYADALNSDTFYGKPAGRAKFAMPVATWKWENGYEYWQVTYQIDFHPEGWALLLLDQGSYELVDGPDSTKVRKPIVDSGVTHSGLVLLDGEGGRLAQSEIDAGNCFWRTPKAFEEKPFAPWGLDYSS